MAFITCKLRDIFEMIHDKENKQFYKHLVLITLDEPNYPCALSDESVRYGTDNYELFEQAIKKDFSPYAAEQILEYEIFVDVSERYRVVAIDTTISYLENENDKKKKILFLNAYPKDEFEETKMYKSGRCSPFSLFGF